MYIKKLEKKNIDKKLCVKKVYKMLEDRDIEILNLKNNPEI